MVSNTQLGDIPVTVNIILLHDTKSFFHNIGVFHFIHSFYLNNNNIVSFVLFATVTQGCQKIMSVIAIHFTIFLFTKHNKYIKVARKTEKAYVTLIEK